MLRAPPRSKRTEAAPVKGSGAATTLRVALWNPCGFTEAKALHMTAQLPDVDVVLLNEVAQLLPAPD